MATDFFSMRAPPHPQHLPEQGLEPGWDSLVYSRSPHASLLVPCEGPPDDHLDEELADEPGFVKVAAAAACHSLHCHLPGISKFGRNWCLAAERRPARESTGQSTLHVSLSCQLTCALSTNCDQVSSVLESAPGTGLDLMSETAFRALTRVQVLTCLHNDISMHMMRPPESGCHEPHCHAHGDHNEHANGHQGAPVCLTLAMGSSCEQCI